MFACRRLNPMRSINDSKALLVIANILFAVTWPFILIHIVSRWSSTSEELHYDLLGLLFCFAVLWVGLLRGKGRVYCLLAASFSFATVLEILRKLI